MCATSSVLSGREARSLGLLGVGVVQVLVGLTEEVQEEVTPLCPGLLAEHRVLSRPREVLERGSLEQLLSDVIFPHHVVPRLERGRGADALGGAGLGATAGEVRSALPPQIGAIAAWLIREVHGEGVVQGLVSSWQLSCLLAIPTGGREGESPVRVSLYRKQRGVIPRCFLFRLYDAEFRVNGVQTYVHCLYLNRVFSCFEFEIFLVAGFNYCNVLLVRYIPILYNVARENFPFHYLLNFQSNPIVEFRDRDLVPLTVSEIFRDVDKMRFAVE